MKWRLIKMKKGKLNNDVYMKYLEFLCEYCHDEKYIPVKLKYKYDKKNKITKLILVKSENRIKQVWFNDDKRIIVGVKYIDLYWGSLDNTSRIKLPISYKEVNVLIEKLATLKELLIHKVKEYVATSPKKDDIYLVKTNLNCQVDILEKNSTCTKVESSLKRVYIRPNCDNNNLTDVTLGFGKFDPMFGDYPETIHVYMNFEQEGCYEFLQELQDCYCAIHRVDFRCIEKKYRGMRTFVI